MDIKSDWNLIRKHISKSFSSSLHVSIASIDEKMNPTVTPIGSLFLNKDQSGFYFEKYPTKLPANVSSSNNNICILAVNSSKLFWIKSLFKGYFSSYPAIKLYGRLGIKRKANEKELDALQKRMKRTKKLKGHQYLWSKMQYVREVNFNKAEMINLADMTSNL